MSAWQSIRVLRASPPTGVNSEERRAVFAAALEQSEQLMHAAVAVGPAARPLPLFYALSQAGRAIAAARLTDSGWRLAGHGLRAPPQDRVTDLLHRVVEPKPDTTKTLAAARRSSFAGVADAIESEALTEPVELGEVWAANPHLTEPTKQMPAVADETWRRPLQAFPRLPDPEQGAASKLIVLVAGLRDDLPDDDATMAELRHYAIREPWGLVTAGKLPNARRFSPVDPHIISPAGVFLPPERPGDALYMSHPRGKLPALIFDDITLAPRQLDPRIDLAAPAYPGKADPLIYPRLGSKKEHLTPLMMWWLLLFGLSSVARYDPELWVATLDLNKSPQAVPIEDALATALETLPQLILDALTV